ncbi:MAG TPA: hypothetical protein VIG47_03875 [Gemmatimonadaceae bacterium]|jgi:hypothetical protein
MSFARFIARVIVVAVACTLTTYAFGWVSLPFVGLVWGFAQRHERTPGSVAALGAVTAWIAMLGTAAARGEDVGAVAERVGGVMQLPSYVFVMTTLAFAALLCGTAAVIGAATGTHGR